MVISFEFRMGQYRDDDHREDAPHFRDNNLDFLFQDIHNLFSSGFNLLSMFLILFYQMDNWSPNTLW